MIFLAFSNSELSPLQTLSREYEQVSAALADGYLRNRYKLFTDPIATRQRLLSQLKQFRKHLSVFLYSGHAGRDGLLVQEEKTLAEGLALELQQALGTLKLVVLNGCSTGGQVERLLELGVPVVIATAAPVGDSAATEFSIRFFECLAEHKTIREAFRDALGPAKAIQPDIAEREGRSIGAPDKGAKNEALWGLFYREEFANLLDSNPLYADVPESSTAYQPNQVLVELLCSKTLVAHPNIQALKLKEEAGELVEQIDREIAVVNALPYPVGEHLRKLFCLVEGDDSGFDKANPQRLAQLGLCYHMTVELIGFVLLAQLWDLLLDRKNLQVPAALKAHIRNYFELSSEQRRAYSYFGLIRQIRLFFDHLKNVDYFVDELAHLHALLDDDHQFAQACQYLQLLHERGEKAAAGEPDIAAMCLQAEEQLGRFFAELDFLGKYMLVSVQDIEVRKYRHSRDTIFSHELVRLMRAMGKNESSRFLLRRHLDNRSLLFLKGPVRPVQQQPGQAAVRRNEFEADELKYINISPFIIDRNAFETNADLSYLYSFDAYIPGSDEYWFRPVKKPQDQKFILAQQPEFEALRIQLNAFRRLVLEDPPALK